MATYVLRLKNFTPQTIPMDRLAAYLDALALLIGKTAPQVEARIREASTAAANSETRRRFERITASAREDRTSAEFRLNKGTVILEFPGATDNLSFPVVREPGEFTGRIIRLGGKDKTLPVGLC
ncbi:MAG: hypothetical protein LBF61_12570 [Azoarcus sp.]|jgi:hypothetical protein|nr:hypothetical protein [Azoarcus sp.]